MLDQLISTPRLIEIDHVDLAAPPERVWQLVRHGDLARSPLIHALFELRALPGRLSGKQQSTTLRIDDLRSSPEQPGFQLLLERAPYGFAVGSIGKVWHGEIPFAHVANAIEYAVFSEPDFVKVAWAVRLVPLGEHDTRLELEVRVDATDDAAWAKFERYFLLIGPGSHFIRRTLLSGLARELGTPSSAEPNRPLPGDELLSDARAEATDGITISATPEQIWPWLLQMGCHRAGFYSVDWLDNGAERSSRELVPELLALEIGQVIPASPHGDEGFEVLQLEPARALVLGGLYDPASMRQLPFAAPRPAEYWQISWAFVLEPLNAASTRLHVRARAAFSDGGQRRAAWMRPVHHFMQRRCLKHLAARVEGRLPRDDYRDVLSGVGGAALIVAGLLTPFLRKTRSHWGVDEATAREPHPGDELVPAPVWSWTHGVEIDAVPERVWRWIAQIGADRGGFYSYQWLENLLGCGIRNADAVHQAWELEQGDELVLRAQIPPLRVVRLERGRYFVAYAPLDEVARASGRPWAMASWLFSVEPLPEGRTRLLTRYRLACSPDVATRLALGPALLEPIGFAMDRRMLLGVKERVEREARYALRGVSNVSSASTSSATFAGLVK
jgi:hypothetical protein